MPGRNLLPLRVVLPLLLLAAALTAPTAARAQGFSTANVQLLQGWAFRDRPTLETDDGSLTTLTFNHFATWAYGDSFFFADLYRANDFLDPSGQPADFAAPARIYAEWHPRLLFGKMLGIDRFFGVFRDFGLAAEVNQAGDGFYAYLAGVGGDFALPSPINVGVNVFYRYDRFVESTWQISPYWTVPFALGKVPLVFAGFLDVAGTKDAEGNWGVDVMTQPQLLLDLLPLFGGSGNKLLAGLEYYVHVRPDRTDHAPQLMLQWTIN